MCDETQKITVIELKMRNLRLRIKCTFSNINSVSFGLTLFLFHSQ